MCNCRYFYKKGLSFDLEHKELCKKHYPDTRAGKVLYEKEKKIWDNAEYIRLYPYEH